MYGVPNQKPQTVQASNLTEGEVKSIRHNWEHAGFAYWFSDYGTEFWKHPVTGQVLEFYEWGSAA